jgi:hypothetical protein
MAGIREKTFLSRRRKGAEKTKRQLTAETQRSRRKVAQKTFATFASLRLVKVYFLAFLCASAQVGAKGRFSSGKKPFCGNRPRVALRELIFTMPEIE